MPISRNCFRAYFMCICSFVQILFSDNAEATSFSHAEQALVKYTEANHAPVEECEAFLSETNFDYTIVTARIVEATADYPRHCRIEGVISPEVQFQFSFPIAWNGRLYMYGNGGYAGHALNHPYFSRLRNFALKNGFATAYTNNGHDEKAEPYASFAKGNLQKELDFFYRSTHLTVGLAKQAVEKFYGKTALHSYYEGCSVGGRSGLMSAQRFPNDFDGILAAAPLVDVTGTIYWAASKGRVFEGRAFTADRVAGILAKAVLDKCDDLDGISDGLISNPLQCTFDPKRDLAICSGDNCLNEDEISIASAMYSDLIIDGQVVFPGYPVGAEAKGTPEDWLGPNMPRMSGWLPWLVDNKGRAGIRFDNLASFFRYLAFPQDNLDFDPQTADLDEAFPRSAHLRSGVLDATLPNLTAFKNAGGKMITYHGWADVASNPLATTRYYENVIQRMGSMEAADVYRVFMVPGMFHCGGGYGTDDFDAMSPLIDWVEKGVAPDEIQARQTDGKSVVRTRPLCMFPRYSRYKGLGDPNEASSFHCVAPN